VSGNAQEADNIFSEQVLRELVRDLIREQLQGDLGERITRNIRKLIKAEIARAMAVHALE
jgi:parvulin-like peptidyl-prolyl isomerase